MHLGPYSQGTHTTCVSAMRWPGEGPGDINRRKSDRHKVVPLSEMVRTAGLVSELAESISEADN